MAESQLASPAPPAPILSKSKFLHGLQCHKLVWHLCNDENLFSQRDGAQEALLEQGKAVGDLAKRLFPDGVEVGLGATDFGSALRLTEEATEQRRPLFEAAFSARGGCCRVDILNPVGDGAWEIVEVKSSTSAKEEHLQDLAFQAWVLAGAGLDIKRTRLMHVNSEYVKSGAVEPEKFFVTADISAEVAAVNRSMEDSINDMLKTVRSPSPPEIKIGPHCDEACPMYDTCWQHIPERNVSELYRGRTKGFSLLAKGVVRLRDIPPDVVLTPKQDIQRLTAVTGQPHIDRPTISAFLNRLVFPVHFLDFETIATAGPLFDGVRPYQQIPFQFSLHIIGAPGAEPEHHMFLAEGRDDPRPEFIRRLRECVRDHGSVVVYNAVFERNRLKECAAFLPEHTAWVRRIDRRMVDLLEPFRSFAYYHPDQGGSASIKAVMPALTGRGYDHLDIQEGGTASQEFLRVTFGDVPEAERQRVRQQLGEYCSQDTEGMIWMVNALTKLVDTQSNNRTDITNGTGYCCVWEIAPGRGRKTRYG